MTMTFTLTEEQGILRDTLARFMDTSARDTALADRWQALAELGALGIGFTEAQGGLGGGPREMALVLEAAGRTRRTEPLIDAMAIPGAALGVADPERLSDLAGGARIVAAAFAEAGDPVGVNPTMRISNGRASGEKALTPGAGAAEAVLISARDGDTLVLAEVSEADFAAMAQPMMDGQGGLRLVLADAPATVIATGEAAQHAIRAGWRQGLQAICAQAVGTSTALFDDTLAYVRVREQFGQPIGRFQVIQHRMADMMIALEESRSLLDMACHVLDSDGPDADLLMARTGILDRAMAIGRDAIQLHGGIGMSEEMPIGRGFRALKVLQGRFGGEPFHRATLRDIPHFVTQ
ncbi:hypothetical protein FGK64_01110 [Arenibacterium halophilum]|uniref:Acyl-CoA dehydrogenase n=2 Tax=Arenibacterium halophilum TaxID=2583821 RepID=A0ABY2XC69_9RHOB|nr:hypothetical protein FGK64_01110 [Arenibacterium halophilum]